MRGAALPVESLAVFDRLAPFALDVCSLAERASQVPHDSGEGKSRLRVLAMRALQLAGENELFVAVATVADVKEREREALVNEELIHAAWADVRREDGDG